jgi:hypothetical protein
MHVGDLKFPADLRGRCASLLMRRAHASSTDHCSIHFYNYWDLFILRRCTSRFISSLQSLSPVPLRIFLLSYFVAASALHFILPCASHTNYFSPFLYKDFSLTNSSLSPSSLSPNEQNTDFHIHA